MPRNTAVFDPTFRGRGIVRSDDITADPRYGRNAPYHGMPDGHLPVRSYLAVPVMARSGEVLGGLFFGHAETGVFGEQAERNIAAMASLAAVAIENARLHETAQRELAASRRAYRERDEVARVLQESLLPARLPDIPGVELAALYSPGEGVVGGDFYDVFVVGDGVWGAAIGDVQGKDARAAAMTSVVRHTLRTTALREAGPGTALGFVNEIVRQDQDAEDPRFATAAFALLERVADGLRVRLAGAGHPPALVVRREGAVEATRSTGPLLGVSPGTDLGDDELLLTPGDTLVLYTDGLTEARSAEGLLGDGPVRELLAAAAAAPPHELAERLDALAEEFSGGRRRDDLALLVLRVSR
jgi:serine phosphatase RsbU (regulator of sigma subunit)